MTPTNFPHRSWLKRTFEQSISLSVDMPAYGIKNYPIHSVGMFCQEVTLDAKVVLGAIAAAKRRGENQCEVQAAIFRWQSIDEMRAFFKEKGVPMNARMPRCHGRFVTDPDDFGKGDYEINQLINSMMVN